VSKKDRFSDNFPLGRHLSVLTRQYYGALTKSLEELDIERHYSILILLESSERKCNQQHISEALNIDKASMVRMLDYLSEKGYIKRIPNPDDRRQQHIALTDKAKKQLPRIHRSIAKLNKSATKGLSASEISGFYKMINTIYRNLSNEPAHEVVVNFKKVR
jgi:DNA-binding MarR family transcriptional regulator